MVTIPQLQANQQNALRSTGPTSLEGKAKASLNSLTHGIFSKDLLAQEDEQAAVSYDEFKNGIFDSLKPRDQLQATLSEKVAVDLWRLRKVLRFEAGAVVQEQEALNDPGSPVTPPDEDFIKGKAKGCREDLEGVQKVLAALSRKGFQLKKVDEQSLEIINDAAYAMYSESLDTEDAQRLYDYDMDLEDLFETVEITETQFIKELKEYCQQQRIPELQHQIEKEQQALKDFYDLREAKRSTAALPSEENIDKMLKYERSIQRSILQNIAIIHKLQGIL